MNCNLVANSGEWVTLNEYIDYKVCSGIVFVWVKQTYTSYPNEWKTLGTLPSQFKPREWIYDTSYVEAGIYGNLAISSDGAVLCKTAANLKAVMSYPL